MNLNTAHTKIGWLDKPVSFYKNKKDVTGIPATMRKIIFYIAAPSMSIIEKLRKLDIDAEDYKIKSAALKTMLQLWAPSALLKTRAAGRVEIIQVYGILQLDFDFASIWEYDIEELKKAVFLLPFVALCSLSCSGNGFYVLIAIKDPSRLREYAEHCFIVFAEYGIKPDTSKGRNAQDLRFVSSDANMLYRENPEILEVKDFKTKAAAKQVFAGNCTRKVFNSKVPLFNKAIQALQTVQEGERWQTVQKVAFTLGGFNDSSMLDHINQAIENNSAFTGQENKYLKCAADCFTAGSLAPLKN